MSDKKSPDPEFSLADYYDQVTPHTTLECDGKSIHYSIPNWQTAWRTESLRKKEPETLEWIAGFDSQDVLIDIGANVGMYSIWAAATVGLRVIAFEPESLNYAVLNQNIVLNSLQDKVTAYCLALNNSNGLGDLYLSDFLAGASCHNFGEEVDYCLNPMQAAFKQGCVSYTLDSLIVEESIPFPTHIKIDVDGLEHKVIEGAKNTICDKKVKSILIELNTSLEPHLNLISEITRLGYTLDAEQVNAATRKDDSFKDIGNYIFYR